jgi:hypothetical protein
MKKREGEKFEERGGGGGGPYIDCWGGMGLWLIVISLIVS